MSETEEKKIIALEQLDTFKEQLDDRYITPMAEDIGDVTSQVKNIFGDEYKPTATYDVGDFCLHNNRLFECIRTISTPTSWNAYDWQLVDLSERVMPNGGNSGQVLTKASNANYDLKWATPSSGGGGSGSDIDFDAIYPVGSIYMSVADKNPAALFGGIWSRLEDRFLIGASNNYPAGAIGGEEKHVLIANEMPSHTHGITVNSNGGHKHALVPSSTNPGANFCVPSLFGLGQSFPTNSSGTTKAHWFGTEGSNKGAWETSTTGTHSHSASATNTGGSNAHNNMPPYLSVYMWKRIG